MKLLAWTLALPLLALSSACNDGTTSSSEIPIVQVPSRPPLGGPIAGLTASELTAFERGRAIFEKRFTPSEGLGPLYNTTSCETCHSTPVTGGSAQLYRNFYVAMLGTAPAMMAVPGLPSAVVPNYGKGNDLTLSGGRKVIPDPATVGPMSVAQRNAPSLFGVGMFEFVSNATIASHADPNDVDGDGISGRLNFDFGQVGRFGYKAQSNNIEVFTRAPLRNQMGITSNPFLGAGGVVSASSALVQVSGDPNLPLTDLDDVPDPEISSQELGDLIAFTRFLAPPRRLEPLSDAAHRGEALFEDLGCVKCHVPALPSSRGRVEAYTDLLLHDMGHELADGMQFGIPQASSIPPSNSTERDFRTQPLWGVSLHGPWLHDGRAETLLEAILLHGGEALAIRQAFEALSASQRADVIEFLEHL
jgi:CxxC motif-containing protein (DUF1111 family)